MSRRKRRSAVQELPEGTEPERTVDLWAVRLVHGKGYQRIKITLPASSVEALAEETESEWSEPDLMQFTLAHLFRAIEHDITGTTQGGGLL